MRMIDDDEVRLKENPEDTRFIKKIHRNETRECGQTKHNGLDAQCYAIIGNRRLGNGLSSLPHGTCEEIKSIPRDSTGLFVLCRGGRG